MTRADRNISQLCLHFIHFAKKKQHKNVFYTQERFAIIEHRYKSLQPVFKYRYFKSHASVTF
jgi:hypothetical protein